MDFDILSSSEFSDNLKCTICKNYLSHLPIYITANGQNICGRCPRSPDKEKCTQNLAFEAVSQFLHFPCRFNNEGCEEKMLPKELPQHEQICPYKIITCPSSSFTGCQWEGAFPTVLQHCLDKHFELFLDKNGEFILDLTRPQQTESFLRYKDSLYVLSKKFDVITNILQCAIYHIKGGINKNNYSCALTLRNGKRVLSDECFTTAYHEKEYISVVLDCLKNNNKASVVSGKIVLEKCIEDEVVIQERINEELLGQLLCTNCPAYVLPPIYYYYGNKICCSDCSSGCDIFRNYNLDGLANLLNYPCKHKSNGCNVILKPEQMKEHQVVCQYGNHDCLFSQYGDCLWSGTGKDMIVHIQENHKENFIENGKKISVAYDNSDTKQYVIKYSNNFFRVVFSTFYNWDWDQRIFNWTVQKVGHFKDNFMYDIEIIDRNDHRRKFAGRQLCLPFTDKDEVFQNKNDYFHFNQSQLEALLSGDDNISFKICIFQ